MTTRLIFSCPHTGIVAPAFGVARYVQQQLVQQSTTQVIQVQVKISKHISTWSIDIDKKDEVLPILAQLDKLDKARR